MTLPGVPSHLGDARPCQVVTISHHSEILAYVHSVLNSMGTEYVEMVEALGTDSPPAQGAAAPLWPLPALSSVASDTVVSCNWHVQPNPASSWLRVTPN